MKKLNVLLLGASLMLVLAACNTQNANKNSDFTPASTSDSSQPLPPSSSSDGSEPDTTVHVESVSLNKESLELEVGDVEVLKETVLPANADNKSVTWSATGDGVISVDDGEVTALKEGSAVVTVKTVDGNKTATCNVSVKAKTPTPSKPEGAVDLEYSTADTLASHGDNYCYFNDPEWWSGASARVNEAYIYNDEVTFDYTYLDRDNPSAPYQNWTVQLMRKNTSLTEGKQYDLSLKLNMSKGGQVIVNDVTTTVVQGDNNIKVSYKQTSGASINIQFPLGMMGSARAVLSDVTWEDAIVAPQGVVVNPVEDYYIVAFAAVPGATGYRAYYVNASGVDVDSEEVTNGGRLNKVNSLPAGKYKVFVTTLVGTKESARSTTFGTLQVGDVEPVVPAGGAKKDMVFGEEHKDGSLALPDDEFVYWNDQGWCGSAISVTSAYTEEGTVNASYTVDAEYEAWGQGYEGCNYCFQIFYKNTSLEAGKEYVLSYTLNSLKAGKVTANGQEETLVASTDKVISVTYKEVANDASFALVFPSSMGNNTIKISNISWTLK